MSLRKSSYTQREWFNGKHRFEHWYRDNTVYFITSKARDSLHVFVSDRAKEIFWDRFTFWTNRYGFEPWVTSLLDNHYHTVGYLQTGENLGPMMQRFHGSVAKLVNDTLPVRHVPFWRTAGNRDYFDGCLRDATQLRRTHAYVQRQAVRAGLVQRAEDHPHTRTHICINEALTIAHQRKAYLETVPYARYD
jgi:hypothetical protein